MENISRKSGDNFHKRIGTGKGNNLNYSTTGSSFYLQENKSEIYQTIIQMLKSDLTKIQDMINSNLNDIKMYKLLSKTPGLTRKLTEIEETKTIKNYIEKINEDSKNIDRIKKIYGCQEIELIQKLYLELSYNELLLKKINDYFILMKIKLYKDDTYQETLSKIIPLNLFMENAINIYPSSGDLNDKIIKLSIDNENLKKSIIEEKIKDKNMKELKELEDKNKEITNLKKEIENIKKMNENKKIINDEKSIFQTEIKINGFEDLKKELEKYEKNIRKERGLFNNNIVEERKELTKKINKLEEENNILIEENKNLEKNIEDLKGKIDQDYFENILREQFQEMKEAFKVKIESLNDELIDIKHETRVKIYQMEEDLKQSNYLKNIFLEQISSLQNQLENKS